MKVAASTIEHAFGTLDRWELITESPVDLPHKKINASAPAAITQVQHGWPHTHGSVPLQGDASAKSFMLPDMGAQVVDCQVHLIAVVPVCANTDVSTVESKDKVSLCGIMVQFSHPELDVKSIVWMHIHKEREAHSSENKWEAIVINRVQELHGLQPCMTIQVYHWWWWWRPW